MARTRMSGGQDYSHSGRGGSGGRSPARKAAGRVAARRAAQAARPQPGPARTPSGRARQTASAQSRRVPSGKELGSINAARKAMGAGNLNVAKHRAASADVGRRMNERDKRASGDALRRAQGPRRQRTEAMDRVRSSVSAAKDRAAAKKSAAKKAPARRIPMLTQLPRVPTPSRKAPPRTSSRRPGRPGQSGSSTRDRRSPQGRTLPSSGSGGASRTFIGRGGGNNQSSRLSGGTGTWSLAGRTPTKKAAPRRTSSRRPGRRG